MLQQEYPYIDLNGKDDYTKIKHYSDVGYELLQIETGLVYSEAIDVYPCPFTYAELIPTESTEEEIALSDNLDAAAIHTA